MPVMGKEWKKQRHLAATIEQPGACVSSICTLSLQPFVSEAISVLDNTFSKYTEFMSKGMQMLMEEEVTLHLPLLCVLILEWKQDCITALHGIYIQSPNNLNNHILFACTIIYMFNYLYLTTSYQNLLSNDETNQDQPFSLCGLECLRRFISNYQKMKGQNILGVGYCNTSFIEQLSHLYGY